MAPSRRLIPGLCLALTIQLALAPLLQGQRSPGVRAPENSSAQALPVVGVSAQEEGDSLAELRGAILAIAESYAQHEWSASAANRLHGPDADGIHVDTPDDSHRDDGWQIDGRSNVGVPYKWGGFSSLAQFDQAVAAGLPAGQLTDGVNLDSSALAVGVDCSGFVARCWQLPVKQSTRSLARLCYELPDYASLLAGDLINKFDAHAMVFKEFADPGHTEVRVIEATFPKVKESVYTVSQLEGAGFSTYRYKPLDPRWIDVGVEQAEIAVERRPGSGRFVPDDKPCSMDALTDQLGSSRFGDWARYEVGGAGGSGTMDMLRTVARTDEQGIVLQCSSTVDAQRLQTQELRDAELPVIERWSGLRDDGQPLDGGLQIEASRIASGSWELEDGTVIPVYRVTASLRGSFTARTNRIPFTVEMEAIVSPELPLEGLLRLEQITTYEIGDTRPVGVRTYELLAAGRGARPGD